MKYKARLKLIDGVIHATEYENTVGHVTWAVTDTGQYTGTLPEAFGAGRVFIPNEVLMIDLEGSMSSIITMASASELLIASQMSNGDFADWLNTSVTFEVFPTSYVVVGP